MRAGATLIAIALVLLAMIAMVARRLAGDEMNE